MFNVGDKVIWFDIATFGSFDEHSVHTFEGVVVPNTTNNHKGFLNCKPHDGTERLVYAHHCFAAYGPCKRAAIVALKAMKDRFNRNMNELIASLGE